ncbi:MAG TPA: DUF3187 family protein [Holophaga sp.]|nr:DUF3187 family protein [Holophaga sp.]
MRAALFLLLASLLGAQTPPLELGPAPTREMFPLYLVTLPYQPVDPTPLGRGRWQASVVHLRSNTFEFSEVLKERAPTNAAGRVVLTREYVEANAHAYADVPIVFYFDEEILRTDFRLRMGLTDRTDLWAELPFQSHTGGYLDRLIEGFHSLGFEQYGRDQVAQDQLTLVVMEHGRIRFFNQERLWAKFQDPTLGLTHRLLERGPWRVSAYFTVKPPITTSYGVYRGGWDHGGGLTARWEPHPHHVFYGGFGLVARPKGSEAYNRDIPGGGFRNGGGFHVGWEGRSSPRWRPYLQLLGQSGYLRRLPYQKLDRPSLQHDVGLHWLLGPRTAATFRYLNNITHNANTADMSLGLSLTHQF